MKRGFSTGFRAGLMAAAALLAFDMAGAPVVAATPGASVASQSAALPALMPAPSSAQFPAGALPASGGFSVTWDSAPTPMLDRAAARFNARTAILAGGARAGASSAAIPVRVHVGEDPNVLTVQAKEGYALSVGANGVMLNADGPTGVLRGFATLAQLIRVGASGPELAFATISDAPRFPWRGMMIDTSRHFMSVETVKRQIDAMELVKLNVLHFHLSDGTGFRVESKVLPSLTSKGSHGEYYTQAQLRDLVAYAADRGVRVVPEFDVPGHALAILLARPDLAAQHPVDPNPKNKNNAALDPTIPGTLELIKKLYAEMGAIFPDQYFHAGGDEVSPKQWTTNPKIVAYMHAHGFATPQALQAAFTADVEKILASQGKIMVGWDEVSEAPIPKNVVVEAWRSSKFISSATAEGHPVIVAVGYYLDLLQSAGQHYLVDPYDPSSVGVTREQANKMLAKGGDPVLINAFLNDPAPPPLNDAQKKLVLGGETPLWAELVTDETLDARFWPRSAAIAERFWSAASVRDVDDMYRRLAMVDTELTALGLQSEVDTRRMMARLAPEDPDAVQTLVSAIVPIRNYRLNRYSGAHGDHLDEIAEIASPDPIASIRFNALAARYAAGDHSVAPELRAQLQAWKDNDAAYTKVATSRGLVEAVPVSHDVASLATLGLNALDGNAGVSDAAARAVLDNNLAQLALSTDITAAFGAANTPVAGVMIAFAPGVKALLGK